MYSRNPVRSLLFYILGAAMLCGTASSSFAGDLASQTSESADVTIAVKPLGVAAGAATWSFQVSLSTNSQDVGDDLVRTAFIVDRLGKKRVAPTAWEGDPPGRYDRMGVLSFKALAPMPKAIELRIQRIGEKAPRMFRWDLDCPCNDPKMHAT